MRDPKRIDKILKTIENIWKKNPDLRLCQLIGNCFPPGDNYNREDDVLEIGLEQISELANFPFIQVTVLSIK